MVAVEQVPVKEKRKPVIVEEYTDETTGHLLRRYETGLVYDMTTKRVVTAPSAEFRGINAENASMLRRQAIDKTREAIKNAIVAKSLENGVNYTTSPVDAVGHAAGELWGLVLNDSTKPRDRREIFETIGRAAGLLADNRRGDTDDDGAAKPLTLNVDALRATVAELERARSLLNDAKEKE